MLALYAKKLAPAFVVVATVSLSGLTVSSAAIAQTATAAQAEDSDGVPAIAQTATAAQAEDSAAVLAALDYLQATRFRSKFEAKLPALVPNKTGLKIALQQVPALENEIARIYAARVTAEELREAGKFFRTAAGALYFNFNLEMNANPYTTAEIYRNEVAKRFTAQQRAEVFAYASSALGQKLQRLMPDIVKAEREAAEQWGRKTQEAIDRALRTGDDVS